MSTSALFYGNKITDGLISKSILSPLVTNAPLPTYWVDKLNLSNEITAIQQVYRKYKKKYGILEHQPKYLPFYYYIQENVDSFAWNILSTSNSKPLVEMKKPYINFKRPSLLTLILCSLRGQYKVTPEMKIKYPSARGMPDKFAIRFYQLLKKLDFYLPGDIYIGKIVETLQKGLEGEQITIISPVCPDYGYEKRGSKYRYTFSELGDGIGLVAGRVVRTLPPMQKLFEEFNIKTNIVVAAGDFEGFDQSTLERVNETGKSFRSKMEHSQSKILNTFNFQSQSAFVSDLCGGEGAWLRLVEEAYSSISGEDFGSLLLTDIHYSQIIEARKPLYRAWFGELSNEQYMSVLLHQCAEYAVMGKLFAEKYPNPIVVGADHVKMMPFYWLYQRIPVLYLKHVY